MDIIATNDAPKAIGPYSQAIRIGNMVYTSGQIALDPATGSLVEGDFAVQARRVFENLKAVLAAAGTDFNNVIKATVYLTDLANFTTLNDIYASYFGDTKPARTTVGVSQLPKGGLVEIDLVAIVPSN
jgi:reactive intermediate/imine deaminase